jgi:hypothetical protein
MVGDVGIAGPDGSDHDSHAFAWLVSFSFVIPHDGRCN